MTEKVMGLFILDGKGSFDQDFIVSLKNYSGDLPSLEAIEVGASGKLPPATDLPELYKDWKDAYRNYLEIRAYNPTDNHPAAFIRERPVEINVAGDYQGWENQKQQAYHACTQAEQKLLKRFHEWLKSGNLGQVQDTLKAYLSHSKEQANRILIESNDKDFQKMPWQKWDLLTPFSLSEVGLSSPNFKKRYVPIKPKERARVLVILGKDANIQQEIQQLATANIEIKVVTTLAELDEPLWNEAWDIIVFNGHSGTSEKGRQGQFQLSQDQWLSIENIRGHLNKAIEQGLKLVIFNSCDGLGLAHQLGEGQQLYLPQIIVMRYLLPMPLAPIFLKIFFEEFIKGISLYSALRATRDRLEFPTIKEEYPCASWLPVICQNQAHMPPTWNDLWGIKAEIQEQEINPPTPSNYNEQTWVGREALVSDLVPKLQEHTRLLWITGISGIGKTALGECLASQSWQRTPSFQWIYLEILKGQSPDFVSVAADLLAKLGHHELDTQERNNPEQLAKRLLQKLQSHSYWIQMDSLERLLKPEQPTEFVDPYWTTFLQCCLTESNVVSRLVLTAQAFPAALVEFSDRYPNTWAEIRLDGLLQVEQQLEFFTKRGVMVEPSNRDILSRIAQIYEGHPLVLKVITEDILKNFAGHVDRYWQVYQPEFEQVARELQATRLDETEYNEALDRKVRERIKRSLEQLSVDAVDLLCRSAVFRRPVPKKFWLAMIGDRSSKDQKAAYRVLDDHALIEKESTDIRQHNLIRDVAYDLLCQDSSIWETAERQAANLWLTAYKPSPNAPKLETVRGYLEAFEHYCQIEDWKVAKELVLTPLNTDSQVSKKTEIYWEIGIWGYFREQIQVCERLLNKLDKKTDAILLKTLGVAYKNIGNTQKAINYYEQSLTIAQEVKDQRLETIVRQNFSNLHRDLGNIQEAMNLLEGALEVSQKIADKSLEAGVLGSLGVIYKDIGQYQKAIDFQTRYLNIAQEIKDKRLEGIATGDLALLYSYLKEYQKAISYYQKELELVHQSEDKRGEIYALCNMALTYYELNDYDRAIRLLEQSLAIAEKIGHLRGKGNALMYLGGIQIKLNLYEIALNNLGSSLKIFRDIQARGREAENLAILADLYQAMSNFSYAITSIQDALKIYQSIGFRAAEAESLKKLAELYQIQGEEEEARESCKQALALATELGIPLVADCEALLQQIDREN